MLFYIRFMSDENLNDSFTFVSPWTFASCRVYRRGNVQFGSTKHMSYKFRSKQFDFSKHTDSVLKVHDTWFTFVSHMKHWFFSLDIRVYAPD